MKIIKTELRNKMSDGWLNDLMVCYIEREIFKGLDLQKIKKAFQNKKTRQMQLPNLLELDSTKGIFLFHLFNNFYFNLPLLTHFTFFHILFDIWHLVVNGL